LAEPVITVPQANPGAAYRALKDEIDRAVLRALNSGWYILGAEGRAFEAEFAAWLGTARAVGCGNGTDALALALRGLGIGPGSTVVTVSHTAVATVAAIEMVGADPLLVDIDPRYYTMDPQELADVLAHPPDGLPPIRAVIPVHLYGQPADMRAIAEACATHGIPVIEDCSQGHGTALAGRKVGSLTEVSCFSLYPTKNLGAFGDGGVLASNDEALATRIAALRQYGWRTHNVSEEPGINSRLDEVQAAVLRVRLQHLDRDNTRRQKIADAYDEALSRGAICPPTRRPDATHVFHQYVIRVPGRPTFQARLRAEGIGTGIHYPVPVHLQPAYRGRVALGPAACERSARAAAEVLSLPIYPELTDAQVEQVCATLTVCSETL
jgi:dTDP-4-amino-4,6-dideoxygalactose transaminase